MANYTLLNYVGNGEKPIIEVPPLDRKRYLTKSDLQPFLAQDAAELQELASRGIMLDHLCDFMEYLLEEGIKSETNEVIDGLFRVWTDRARINRTRVTAYGINKCPMRTCSHQFDLNRDIFFNPSEYPYAEGKNELDHYPLRINDISIHLARHGIFQKGEGGWDQCYPTSPQEFAENFYIPWLNRNRG